MTQRGWSLNLAGPTHYSIIAPDVEGMQLEESRYDRGLDVMRAIFEPGFQAEWLERSCQ